MLVTRDTIIPFNADLWRIFVAHMIDHQSDVGKAVIEAYELGKKEGEK